VTDRPLQRTRHRRLDLQSEWERNAPGFITWARKPRHDSYWLFHRDVFLELMPPPRGRTLDLGCGEGRLSRDLKAVGHDVVAVDGAPTMVAAAREADPELEVQLADAASLPFADATFGCVVALMSLQDIDDLGGAIGEVARVLTPRGVFCAAIVHPLSSSGTFVDDTPDSGFLIDGSYFEPSHYVDEFSRDGVDVTMASVHRPLQDYTECLAAEGFVIERLREPAVPEHGIWNERSRRWQRLPPFLHIRASKR
jgi:SAM-dependent methyltransferase